MYIINANKIYFSIKYTSICYSPDFIHLSRAVQCTCSDCAQISGTESIDRLSSSVFVPLSSACSTRLSAVYIFSYPLESPPAARSLLPQKHVRYSIFICFIVLVTLATMIKFSSGSCLISSSVICLGKYLMFSPHEHIYSMESSCAEMSRYLFEIFSGVKMDSDLFFHVGNLGNGYFSFL